MMKDVGCFMWQGVDLLEKAAALGDSTAQNSLGYMYSTGLGVDIDAAKGQSYHLMAAAQDQPEALYHVGEDYYAAGDYVTALAHFQRSADLGDLPAAYREGQLFETGVDMDTVPRSCRHAVDAYKVSPARVWICWQSDYLVTTLIC